MSRILPAAHGHDRPLSREALRPASRFSGLRREYKELIEWLDRSFDPNALDASPEEANKYLRKLRWPRTTIAHLGSFLMQRDRVRA